MIKLIELFNEIKVNNPNEVFQVTKEGEQAYKDYHTLHKLVVKYITDDYIGVFDDVTNSSKWWDLLNFSIMLDENLIKIGIINQNKIYLDKAINDIGWEVEDAIKYLEGIRKQGWIK